MALSDLPWVTKEEGDYASIVLNISVYSIDIIFRTCYSFTDRCFLFLTEEYASSAIKVHFAPMNCETDLTKTVGDFCNALIDERLRALVASETHSVRALIVAQAFAEADLLDDENSNEPPEQRGE